MRFHKIANVNKALEFISSKGVKLVSIGAEGRRISPISVGFIPHLPEAKRQKALSVITAASAWSQRDCTACFPFRDRGWECEDDSGNDLDHHPALRHSGHLCGR